MVDRENPYRQAMIRGRVVEQRPDADCAIMNEISPKYTSEFFLMTGPERIVLVIEPEWSRYLELPFTHRPG